MTRTDNEHHPHEYAVELHIVKKKKESVSIKSFPIEVAC